MSVVKKAGFIVVSSLWLVACSSHYSNNAGTSYLSSHNGPDLVVPPPLTTGNLGYFYQLPQQKQDARVSIRPPTV